MPIIVIFMSTEYWHMLNPESYKFEPRSWQGVLNTTLCDKVCH
jgi:hypothetical protein